ncbi:MAG: hypothetical protein RLZZ444_1372 [Pseudomonadota bacterium]
MSAPVALNVNLILDMIRSHLNMDIAFLAEFADDVRVFRGVSSGVGNPPIRAGDIHPLGAGYCQRVVDCALPELIPNTADLPLAMAIPETADIPIGAHLSVPVRFGDGQIYGTLCCFSFLPRPNLGQPELDLLHQLAGITANLLGSDFKAHQVRRRKRKLVEGALSSGDPAIVFQPIVSLDDRRHSGFEALSRFAAEPIRSPDRWFADAEAAGIGGRVELLAAQRALLEARALPAEATIGVNLSPKTILTSAITPLVSQIDPSRLVIELTEHAPVEDYESLIAALAPIRRSGVRIAIDDAGAGYASLQHVLKLEPDIIKFDVSLTRGIDNDQRRVALVGALVEYCRRTGTSVVAEGVETQAEEAALRTLGVDKAQGYLFGRPLPASDYAN